MKLILITIIWIIAAIRSWLVKAQKGMSFFEVVFGISAVMDWSLQAQDRDRETLKQHLGITLTGTSESAEDKK